MKISSSNLQLQAQHSASQTQTHTSRLQMWIGQRPGPGAAGTPFDSSTRLTAQAASASVQLRISEAARQASLQSVSTAPVAEPAQSDVQENLTPQLTMMRDLIQLMTGVSAQPSIRPQNPAATATLAASQKTPGAAGSATNPEANFGAIYEQRHVLEESEQLQFSAQGVVRTTDGREIRFSLELQMQRSYREESSSTLRLGNAKQIDPLVINFDGTAAQLQDMRFTFDLNGDGEKEQVPLLAGARGYLALDRNGNGEIDNGLELFGPQSGNGFTDLAAYDEDGNGWIDENDPVFERLQAWTPTAQGAGSLQSLQQIGVGAIHLGATATPFALRGEGNQSLGTVRASSVYLRENGSAGTVQHVDLSV